MNTSHEHEKIADNLVEKIGRRFYEYLEYRLIGVTKKNRVRKELQDDIDEASEMLEEYESRVAELCLIALDFLLKEMGEISAEISLYLPIEKQKMSKKAKSDK